MHPPLSRRVGVGGRAVGGPPGGRRAGGGPAARAALLDQHHLNLLQELCFGVVIERPLVNIDDPFDLELAEWLMARQADS